MKTRHILLVILTLGLFACNSEPEVETFMVNVNLANADGQMAYLQRDGQVLDSAVITNWEAALAAPVGNGTETYGLMLKGWRRAFPFFTDNTDVTLEGDAQNPNAIVVTGSEANDRLITFTEGFNEYDLQMDSLSQLLQEAKAADNQKEITRLQRELDDMEELQKMYCFDYVWDFPADPVAHYVLYRYKWAFGPCEMRNMIDNIRQNDSAVETYNLVMAEEYVEKQERVQAGQPIIDFTQNDPDGNPVTLSQLAKGKLLLVDFWASWCPDCRKANPDVVAAYEKFHDQGFDVLGVSFDTNKEAWLAAVETDGLPWTQVRDLQGWNNAAGALYAISFIPQNALIKDGKIVARNLEGAELMEEIDRQIAR